MTTSDIDERDRRFIIGDERTSEGFYFYKNGADTAIAHQKFVGTGYFDRVMSAVTEGQSSVEALADSTEKAQF